MRAVGTARSSALAATEYALVRIIVTASSGNVSPRLKAESVRHLVEFIYRRDASTIEKINWRLRRKPCPYPAEFVKIEGMPFSQEISCGHNPRLRARQARLHIAEDNTVTWTDNFTLEEVRAIQRRRKREKNPFIGAFSVTLRESG